MNFYVYIHKDPRTNLVRYVGKGCGERANQLSRRSAHHKHWIASLNQIGLKPIIEIIEHNLAEEEAFKLEKLWIATFKNTGITLCNSTSGGEGVSGFKHSEKQRAKISKRTKEAMNNAGLKNKLSKAKQGKPPSNRRKIIAVNKISTQEIKFESLTDASIYFRYSVAWIYKSIKQGRNVAQWQLLYSEEL